MQNTIINLLGLFSGMFLLWIGGDFSVRYAVRVAQAYRISTFFIGFFMLAAGALIPDIMVAIISGLKNAGPLSAGEVVGANFSDITLVSGISMFLAGAMNISQKERRLLLAILGLSGSLMFLNFAWGEVTKIHGAFLVLIFIAFCCWVWKKEAGTLFVESETIDPQHHEKISLLLMTKLLGSFSLVLAGSMLAVTFAVKLSASCSYSLETIGATLMGIGTSLPEFAVSLNALRRKEYGLALGPTLSTVLGQGTLILGLLALVSPSPISLVPLRSSAVFMFIGFIIISYSIFKDKLSRSTGVVLVSLFCAYIAYHLI